MAKIKDAAVTEDGGLKTSKRGIETVDFSSREEILQEIFTQKFGARFSAYREDYFRTLNADKDGFVPEKPVAVTLELVNRCNLTCSMCYTANHVGEKSTLSLDDVRKAVIWEDGSAIPCVMIGMGSEALLRKDIKEIILEVKRAGVMDIFLFTNGTLLSEELAEFLVAEEVARVFVSLDATKPETYEKIRGKDLLPTIETNVKTLCEIKKRRNSPIPIVRLSFCAQEANQGEQAPFVEKWKGVVDHVDIHTIIDHSAVDGLIEDPDSVSIPPPTDGQEGAASAFCSYPFAYLNVWANGDITPCCNFHGKAIVVGNIRHNSLQEVWTGPEMAELRKEFMARAPRHVCSVCLSAQTDTVDDEIKDMARQIKSDY